MTRTIFAAIIATAAITTAAAAIAATNSSQTASASAGSHSIFSVDVNGMRDCAAQTWPNIDPACLKDIDGQPANREFRAVAL